MTHKATVQPKRRESVAVNRKNTPLKIKPVKKLAILVVAFIGLLSVCIGINLDAIHRWRYERTPLSELLSAARQEPQNLSLIDVTGARLIAANRYAEARSLLMPIAEQHPQDAETNLLAGRAEWKIGDPQQAGRLLFTALQAAPTNAEVCYWGALFLYDRGDKTKAEELLFQVTVLAPQRGDAWLDLGEIAYKSRNYTQAIERLDHADQLTPTAAVALLRAKVFKDMGRYDQAEAAARQAITREPTAAAYTLLGEIMQLSPGAAKQREAQGYLQEALKKAPHDVDTLKLLGINYYGLGEYQQAVQVLRQMLRNQPALPEGYLLLSQSYRAWGKVELADKCLRIFRLLEPLQVKVKEAQARVSAEKGSVPAQLQYARALLALGRRDLAQDIIEHSWIKAPNNPAVKVLASLAQGPPSLTIPPLPPDPVGDEEPKFNEQTVRTSAH